MIGLLGLPTHADDVDFNRDIRPILSNHCFQCHGQDEDSREADLRLDSLDQETVKRDDSSPAIVAGDSLHSGVMQRVNSDDPDVQMPPKKFGKPLNETQIALLKKWIDGGANFAKHW